MGDEREGSLGLARSLGKEVEMPLGHSASTVEGEGWDAGLPPFLTCPCHHPRSVAMVMSGRHEVEKEAGWTSPAVPCLPPGL